MSAATKLTPKKIQAFLASLAKHGNVTAAAAAAGVTRFSVYSRRGKDDEFAADWDDAVEKATDLLVMEAKRRAFRGTRKPVFHKGVVCGHVREYSDSLMMFLVKARRPEYRDKTDMSVSGTINLNVVRYVDNPDDTA